MSEPQPASAPNRDEALAAELRRLQGLQHAQARLVRAVQELSLARTLPEVQVIVRRAAREIAGADGATFVLRDHEQCFYVDEDAIAPLWKGQRFPLSACISGWAMLNRAPAVIPDIYADPRVPTDAYRPTFVKSLVMVPIRRDAPIGAIGTYWAHNRRAAPEEVELLQALANTTAVAIENAGVYATLEQRVADRTRQLEAVNGELEAFSYSVSHDLRAPLRAIRGFTELLARELGEGVGGEAARYLAFIRDGGQRMSDLIDALLQLARVGRQDVRRSTVDLSALVRRIVARFREAEPARAVEVVVEDGVTAAADPGLMAVALENLLSNAWKYSAKAEHPRIEFGVRPGAAEPPEFFVRDNGVGFPAEKASSLFAPFQRLHSAAEFPGTGIGLATVQRIMHRHGGRAWAEAGVGQGATFHFTCGPRA